MEFSEFNAYINGYAENSKQEVLNFILTGYFTAYYNNSGKKAKPPQQLYDQICNGKQNFEEGLREINKIKELEKRRQM